MGNPLMEIQVERLMEVTWKLRPEKSLGAQASVLMIHIGA